MAEGTPSAPPPRPASSPAGPAPRRPGVPGGVMQKMEKGGIAHVVAVGSGKGGVGKSTATALLASALRRQGLAVGVLDADITGPSIPKLFGLSGPLVDRGEGIEPATSAGGISVVSSQFLVEDAQTPVIWRGPLVTRLIMQFFGGVNWGKLDYLLLDMPPGTSDVPLTVFQTIPIDGMVFVLTPQELAALIVKKAMNMARDLHVPLLGLVENMGFLTCPHCGKPIELFGPSGAATVASEYGVPLLGKLPLDPSLSKACDAGAIEAYRDPAADASAASLVQAIASRQTDQPTVL
ncbi:MAG TPA: Mrp/NBP35 family ATP-binding protein [Thermoplasmata archaeon]|nr:Mrp/NBP35 family ATP-binding protein [Thermoplasmata archaeon]